MYACTLSLAGTKKMTNNLQDEQENLLSNVNRKRKSETVENKHGG